MSKEYERLSKIKKKLRISWYRCPIEKETLKNLTLRSDLKGLMQAGGHFALFLLTGIITYYFWFLGMWYSFLISLFLHGTVTSFLSGVAPHELGHGTVFRTRVITSVFYIYLAELVGGTLMTTQ